MSSAPRSTLSDFRAGSLRDAFLLPRDRQGGAATYLCGNSLGLQPRGVHKIVEEELASWAARGVDGHMEGPRPWVRYGEDLNATLGHIVGAGEHEVALTSTLTANLHQLLATFYRPGGRRRKIVVEHGGFPSDRYVATSQIAWHRGDPAADLVVSAPADSERSLSDAIIEAIEDAGDQLALVFVPGVHFATGEVLDIAAITQRAHAAGAYVCVDLAHSVGNTELELHNWQVDCAAWCSYKYLNGGPGAIGGLFVHEKHLASAQPRLSGWWSNRLETRFAMAPALDARPDAGAWALSNVPVLSLAPLYASLPMFQRIPMRQLAAEGARLQRLLRRRLEDELGDRILAITPQRAHGAQLSISLRGVPAGSAQRGLAARGIICDSRPPDILRAATAPLYNNEDDVDAFVAALHEVLTNTRAS